MILLLPALLQAIPPDSGEVHLRNIRQLTFGGQNAEAYFSRSGRQLIFQRQEADSGCDQEFVMNVDGSDLHRVSNGKGRTTCGYFFDRDARIFYASTQHAGAACPPRPITPRAMSGRCTTTTSTSRIRPGRARIPSHATRATMPKGRCPPTARRSSTLPCATAISTSTPWTSTAGT